MTPALEAIRSSRPAVVAVIVASIAVTALALAAIARLLGWVGREAATPVGIAAPAQQVAGAVPEVVLAPGETLIEAPDASAPARPEPLMPPYKAPHAPAPAPAPPPEQKAAPRPAKRAPTTPRYAHVEHPSSPTDPWPQSSPCLNCGAVISIITYPDMSEVRVRFEDGAVRTLRYPSPAPFRLGERVRLEGGRLLRD